MKNKFFEEVKKKNVEINQTLDQVGEVLNRVSPKLPNYGFIDVAGVEALQTQLNQYADAGYELKFLVLGDINNSFIATVYSTAPRSVNINGNPISTKYRVITILGTQALAIKTSTMVDEGYKMVAQVRAGRDIVAVFER